VHWDGQIKHETYHAGGQLERHLKFNRRSMKGGEDIQERKVDGILEKLSLMYIQTTQNGVQCGLM